MAGSSSSSGGGVPTRFLELMSLPPSAPLMPPVKDATVVRDVLTAEPFMALYRAIGGPYSWDHGVATTLAAAADFLARPGTSVFVLRIGLPLDAPAAGFCVFERAAAAGDTELVYFGLLPLWYGQRLGPYLLDAALRSYWAEAAPQRVWLHTDAWDHPSALALYQRAGFSLFAECLLPPEATAADYREAAKLTR